MIGRPKHLFTPDQLDLARQMRAAKKGWASIGRELQCHERTIRAAIDPSFDYAAKVRKSDEAKRDRRKAERAAKAERLAAAAKSYDNNLKSFV